MLLSRAAATALLLPRRLPRPSRLLAGRAASAMSAPSPASVVYVTVPSSAVGSALARALVSAKLAACVNIVPAVRSVYVWKGELCEDDELLLIIKTREELLGAHELRRAA